MSEMIPWQRSMTELHEELQDLVDEFEVPPAFRREMLRVFDEFSTPRPLMREMDRLLEDFESPPTLRRRIARTFESFMETVRRPFTRSRTRSRLGSVIDLSENAKEYVVKVDLPGMREEDVDVRLRDDRELTIRAERSSEELKRFGGSEYSERSRDSLLRSIQLPDGVDAAKITADLRGGRLEVRIPKAVETRGQRIPITRKENGSQTNGPTAQQS